MPAPHAHRRVAVYCGSSDGSNAAYLAGATVLGRTIAEAGLGMVYGGANIGLMGATADAALTAGAEVLGVLPEFLAGREITHTGLTRLEIVATMHQRKARMVALADAFLILPGGYGTLDELFEILTWSQLRIHAKPCILINTLGYWNPLLAFADSMVASGFLPPKSRGLMQVAPDAAGAVQMVVAQLTQHQPLEPDPDRNGS